METGKAAFLPVEEQEAQREGRTPRDAGGGAALRDAERGGTLSGEALGTRASCSVRKDPFGCSVEHQQEGRQ